MALEATRKARRLTIVLKARMGKTSMDKSAGGDLECVCFRPLKKIVCRICGKMIIGRVR